MIDRFLGVAFTLIYMILFDIGSHSIIVFMKSWCTINPTPPNLFSLSPVHHPLWASSVFFFLANSFLLCLECSSYTFPSHVPVRSTSTWQLRFSRSRCHRWPPVWLYSSSPRSSALPRRWPTFRVVRPGGSRPQTRSSLTRALTDPIQWSFLVHSSCFNGSNLVVSNPSPDIDSRRPSRGHPLLCKYVIENATVPTNDKWSIWDEGVLWEGLKRKLSKLAACLKLE